MGNLNPYYNESFVFIVEQEQLRVKPDKPTFYNSQFFCMMNSSQHDQLTIQFRIVYKVLLRWQRKKRILHGVQGVPFFAFDHCILFTFQKDEKHWDMQKRQDQRKICINANLSTRCSAFEAGDWCVGLWPPGTIRGHWVGGACWREGPQRSGLLLNSGSSQ